MSHRIAHLLEDRLPARNADNSIPSMAFMPCPLPLVPGIASGSAGVWQNLHQWAYEQAKQAVGPSWIELALGASLN